LFSEQRESFFYQEKDMPHKAGIPTKGEIAKLPRWARVAFAARCARRVQPVFTSIVHRVLFALVCHVHLDQRIRGYSKRKWGYF
jgi:hypothetical protein